MPEDTWQAILRDALALLPRRGVERLADQLRRGGPRLCHGVTVAEADDGRLAACPLAYAAAEGELDYPRGHVEDMLDALADRLPDPACDGKASRLRQVLRWWDDMHAGGYGDVAREEMLAVLDDYLALTGG